MKRYMVLVDENYVSSTNYLLSENEANIKSTIAPIMLSDNIEANTLREALDQTSEMFDIDPGSLIGYELQNNFNTNIQFVIKNLSNNKISICNSIEEIKELYICLRETAWSTKNIDLNTVLIINNKQIFDINLSLTGEESFHDFFSYITYKLNASNPTLTEIEMNVKNILDILTYKDINTIFYLHNIYDDKDKLINSFIDIKKLNKDEIENKFKINYLYQNVYISPTNINELVNNL